MKSSFVEAGVIPIDILLVDDREENLLALEAVLQSPDYRLVKLSSGDQALRYLLDHQPPALIVMDVQMPGLDGFETAAIIKGGARTREIPIIFITALNKDERYLHKGYEHGAVDYIYKPFDAPVLRSKVAVFADLHRKSERLIRTERLLRETETRERERKIAELELKGLRREQVEQRRYRELVDGINQGMVWAADPQTLSISFVSDSAGAITGYESGQWLDQPQFLAERIHPEDRAAFQTAVNSAVSTGAEQKFQHRFLTADRGIIWLHTGLRVSTRPSDMVAELRGLSVDVTKLKEAEETMRRSKIRSDLLARGSLILGEGLQCQKQLDDFGRFAVQEFCDLCIVDWFENARFHRSFTLGEPLEGNRDHCQAAFSIPPELTQNAPRIERAEFFSNFDKAGMLRIFDNEERMQELVACGLTSAVRAPLMVRGRYLGTLTLATAQESRRFFSDDAYFVEDLAYRVATLLENARLYQETEAAVRVRDEFLAIASHELRTPLTPLKLQAQQLLRSIRTKGDSALSLEAIGRMVNTTNRQVERLAKLIDSLLDITRISRGTLRVTPAEVELGQLFQEVSTRLAGELETAGCELRLELESSALVYWDSFRMEQVIENLISNAAKYARGKPIEVKAWSEGDQVQISVRDHGIGISKEDQVRIFKRFERAVSSSHFGGLGLGLYIVTQILEAHRGRISVESEPGKGACFTVSVPRRVLESETKTDSAAS